MFQHELVDAILPAPGAEKTGAYEAGGVSRGADESAEPDRSAKVNANAPTSSTIQDARKNQSEWISQDISFSKVTDSPLSQYLLG